MMYERWGDETSFSAATIYEGLGHAHGQLRWPPQYEAISLIGLPAVSDMCLPDGPPVPEEKPKLYL